MRKKPLEFIGSHYSNPEIATGEGRLTRINDILSNLMEAEGRIGKGR